MRKRTNYEITFGEHEVTVKEEKVTVDEASNLLEDYFNNQDEVLQKHVTLIPVLNKTKLHAASYMQQASVCNVCKHRPTSTGGCNLTECKLLYIHALEQITCNCGKLMRKIDNGMFFFCIHCKRKVLTVNEPKAKRIKAEPLPITNKMPSEMLQKDVTDKKVETNDGGYYNVCIKCRKSFYSKRAGAKTCSTRCRVAAARAKKSKPAKILETLTVSEILLLQRIGQLALDNLEFDKDADEYRSNYENWMCNLDKSDYLTLKKALKK